jgi:hypothetical protein
MLPDSPREEALPNFREVAEEIVERMPACMTSITMG